MPKDRPGDFQGLYDQILEVLRTQGNSSGMLLALLQTAKPLGLVEDTLLLAVSSAFAKNTIENDADDAFLSALREVLGEEARFAIVIDKSLRRSEDSDATPQPAVPESPSAFPSTPSIADSYLRQPPATPDPTRQTPPLSTFGTSAPTPTDAPASGRFSHPGAPTPSGISPLGSANTQSPHSAHPLTGTAGSAASAGGAGAAGAARPEVLPGFDNHPGTPPAYPMSPTGRNETTRLNPKYTFDTFVSGPSNRFAHAASTAVAENPGRTYNPLFIYGGSGLGKTHLLHAIGNYALSLYPQIRVKYVNSEEFTNDFINSIRDDRAEVFQRRYRSVDVLLIDDIQFLSDKEQTLEEFFHTFNTLDNDNKQIVITSDVPPKQLSGFEERLTSRFEKGLLADVQPPDLETRIAILAKKASAENMDVSREVLEHIATKITTNIRELEGALIRVNAYASLNGRPVELSLAQMVLKDLLADAETPEITPSLIVAQTSSYFSISIDALKSVDRTRAVTEARQIAMYLCRELTPLSFPQIGEIFGGRDHTTVMHAERKISALLPEQRDIYNHVTELTQRIKSAACL